MSRRGTSARGSVLVQVLMMGVLMMLLAALVFKMVMHRANVGEMAKGGVMAKGADDGLASTVMSVWQNPPNNGSTCCSGGGVTCSPATCSTAAGNSCSCTAAGTYPNSYFFLIAGKTCACSIKTIGDTCPTTVAQMGACP